jgi:starch phosphorylase
MKVRQIEVRPSIPTELRPLEELARNLWHSWNWEAVELFVRLNPASWDRCGQNPLAMLGDLTPADLTRAARDESYIAAVQRVHREMVDSLAARGWYGEAHAQDADMLVAYFCAEFGIDHYVPIYSGGLGVLAGDHLKSASDLAVPIVGVGLLYQQGYFRQVLTADGFQQERYPENDWFNLPVRLERGADGQPVMVSVEMAGETVHARVWRVDVGRVPLLLLDSNVEENPSDARMITAALYAGDRDARIRQELLLGVGGVRALDAVGMRPTVFHMNEGHSAFLVLERIRRLIAEGGLTFHEAREVATASSVFTTHTPVPAGNEVFEQGLAERYLRPMVEELGVTWPEVLALAQPPGEPDAPFGMTPFALRNAAVSNGVSALHAEVSRKMWRGLWPGLPDVEMPIAGITNGVHTRTWLSHQMEDLLLRYLGMRLLREPGDHSVWGRIESVPPGELWRVHELRRERLVFFARQRLRERLRRLGAGTSALRETEEVLDPKLLTIGFARRFATYKRASLLFSRPERLLPLITDPERPVQMLIAGKAHPQDGGGKEVIRSLIHFVQEHGIGHRVVFLEDYDMNMARFLVQGVDVWLNTPRKPHEASGTSGMKAAANGALNLSVLDGWWDEGYEPEVGWAIGREPHADDAEGDRLDAEELYALLEQEIVPLFYERDRSGLPREWIGMMKSSMARVGARFNTHRMVQEYAGRSYLPAHRAGLAMAAYDFADARRAAAWRARVVAAWPAVRVESVNGATGGSGLRVGDWVRVEIRGKLGGLSAEDVVAEVRFGPLDADRQIGEGATVAASHVGREGGEDVFVAELPLSRSGRLGYAVRLVARHPDLPGAIAPVPVAWE